MARFTAGLLVGATLAVIGLAAVGAHAAAEGGVGGDEVEAVVTGTPTAESPPTPEPPAGVWDTLARCESTSNWHIQGRLFSGGLQFTDETWLAYGGGVYASRAGYATRGQQIAVAERLRAARGFQPWPACSRLLGLR